MLPHCARASTLHTSISTITGTSISAALAAPSSFLFLHHQPRRPSGSGSGSSGSGYYSGPGGIRAVPHCGLSNKSILARHLSVLAPHRPRSTSTPLPCTSPTFLPLTSPTTPACADSTGLGLDLLPRISAHPALRSTQLRNGPRDTFRPSHIVRKRRFGFLARLRTRTGRRILKRRKAKGRKSLSH